MPTLPPSCAACSLFVGATTKCHRHAPGHSDEPFVLAVWPKVRVTDKCGSGSIRAPKKEGGSKKKDTIEIIPCRDCIHWDSPEGGLKPELRRGKPREWWAEAGICTYGAPSPRDDEFRKTYWLATHATEGGCGDGVPVQVDESADPDTGP